MHFCHSPDLWRDYPQLVCRVIVARGMTVAPLVGERTAKFAAIAEARLRDQTEAQWPEVQAWRRVFSSMGLKPTQYRCAAESLLRRFKREGSLPALHPLVDLCNAVSLAFGVPIAIFDVANIADFIEVRRAHGDELFVTLSGEHESPVPGEIVFVDALGRAHARRWTHRQSGLSAVREETRTVLIVAEGMHESAGRDLDALVGELSAAIHDLWPATLQSAALTAANPRFEFVPRRQCYRART